MKPFTSFAPVLLALVSLGPVYADVRVNHSDAIKAAVNKPAPDYSAIAKQMRVTGKVEVEAVIAPDGNVEDVRAISGNALLTPNVVSAVKKWKFTPFTEGGQPAKAIAVLSFNFQ
jgi:TonB family protein